MLIWQDSWLMLIWQDSWIHSGCGHPLWIFFHTFMLHHHACLTVNGIQWIMKNYGYRYVVYVNIAFTPTEFNFTTMFKRKGKHFLSRRTRRMMEVQKGKEEWMSRTDFEYWWKLHWNLGCRFCSSRWDLIVIDQRSTATGETSSFGRRDYTYYSY